MNRVACLDGLRGLAAFWVLVGHCMILTGFHLPILSKPDLGVDLFMLLSGFLMVFQYHLRKDREDWEKSPAWLSFWIRRFFRISPLYYFCLIVALLIGPYLYADRVIIDTFLGRYQQAAERYSDFSLGNILAHVSYVFGLLPSYAHRTPLPDWSLTLEMQFYASFPFIVLLARYKGWITTTVILAVIGAVIAYLLGLFSIHYPMPTFLPLKLHVFLAGMLVAAALQAKDGKTGLYFLLATLLTAIPIGGTQDLVHMATRVALVTGLFLLVHGQSFPLLQRLSESLGKSFFHWLGELSYGVYLIHLLVLQPVAAWVIVQFGADIHASLRFLMVFAMVGISSYLLAFVTYKLIEIPGQEMGRRITGRLFPKTGTNSPRTASQDINAA